MNSVRIRWRRRSSDTSWRTSHTPVADERLARTVNVGPIAPHGQLAAGEPRFLRALGNLLDPSIDERLDRGLAEHRAGRPIEIAVRREVREIDARIVVEPDDADARDVRQERDLAQELRRQHLERRHPIGETLDLRVRLPGTTLEAGSDTRHRPTAAQDHAERNHEDRHHDRDEDEQRRIHRLRIAHPTVPSARAARVPLTASRVGGDSGRSRAAVHGRTIG